MIYLDNAATTFPKPMSVRKAVNECLRDYSANPGRGGHMLSIKASEEVFACRTALSDFFNAAGPDRVIFTQSCTVSINTVLKGVLKPGDHVICSCLEHNAVARPLNKLVKNGISFDKATVFTGDFDATVRSFEALIKNNTKMIICTHASNVTGAVLPIEKLGKLCRDYGLLFAVDAAQSAGVLDIDMEKQNIDYLCIAAHKGLYAPMGVGVLIADSEIPETLVEGGTGSLSRLLEQPEFMPDKFESGTVNLSGIAGLRAGVNFVKTKQRERIYSSELSLIKKAYLGLAKIEGVKLYTPPPVPFVFAPVLSFNIEGISSEKVGEALNKLGIAVRPGLHCAPFAHEVLGTIDGGTVRIAPSVSTAQADIERLLSAVKNVVKYSK